MKLTKKLLPAVVMLLVSAIMLTTSSFAWFSMNTDVSATGMQITAKADQVYLQISNGAKIYDANGGVVAEGNENKMFSDKVAMTTVEAANKGTKKVDNVDTPIEYVPITVGTGLTNSDKTLTKIASAPTNTLASNTIKWYTNTSKDPAASTAADAYVNVSTPTETYCLINTFYLRLNPAAGKVSTESNLVCTASLTSVPTDDNLYKSVSVLVVCGDYAQLLNNPSTTGVFTTYAGNKLTTDGFANPDTGEGVAVQVYIFFDGENAACMTNNIKANSYSVDLYFSLQA